MAFSLNDETTAYPDAGQVLLWDICLKKTRSVLHGNMEGVTAVDFSKDSCRLASGSKHATVRLWDGFSGAARGDDSAVPAPLWLCDESAG
jgi:WD40 repeat protein